MERNAWLRGGLTVGIAGTLAAVALIGPVGAVKESKEASKGFVKKQFAAATSQITSQVDALKAQLEASSASNDGPTDVGATITSLASLSLPAGKYLVIAKSSFALLNGDPSVVCELRVGGTLRDTTLVELDADTNEESVGLQAVDTLAAAGTAELGCSDGGGGNVEARFAKVSAISVA